MVIGRYNNSGIGITISYLARHSCHVRIRNLAVTSGFDIHQLLGDFKDLPEGLLRRLLVTDMPFGIPDPSPRCIGVLSIGQLGGNLTRKC